jgi:hypothetical protein
VIEIHRIKGIKINENTIEVQVKVQIITTIIAEEAKVKKLPLVAEVVVIVVVLGRILIKQIIIIGGEIVETKIGIFKEIIIDLFRLHRIIVSLGKKKKMIKLILFEEIIVEDEKVAKV